MSIYLAIGSTLKEWTFKLQFDVHIFTVFS